MYPTVIEQSIVVIYHANCLDGTAAAYAASLKFGNDAKYIPFTYSMIPDLTVLAGKEIYVVDFSFKREAYLALVNVAKSVVVLDHHKTAHEEIGDLIPIDQTKSGAVLAWEYFHPGIEIPKLYLNVQDRDLWQWRYPDTAAVCAYCFLKPLTLYNFEKIMHTELKEIVGIGQVIVDYNTKEMNRVYKSHRYINFLGYNVPIVNGHLAITSELGNKLALEAEFAIIYNDNKGTRMFSLRSAKDDVDVSAMAKVYGGGGHFAAAGFTLPIDSPLLDNFLHEIKSPI